MLIQLWPMGPTLAWPVLKVSDLNLTLTQQPKSHLVHKNRK